MAFADDRYDCVDMIILAARFAGGAEFTPAGYRQQMLMQELEAGN
jgi:hypothetical protein